MLKDFVYQCKSKKAIFDLEKGHVDNKSLDSNKNSLFNIYIIYIFLFITMLISFIVTTIVIYIGCKHEKLKSLVTRFAFWQIKGIDAVFDQGRLKNIYCTCKIQWYTIAMLLLILLGIIFVTTKVRKLSLFGG